MRCISLISLITNHKEDGWNEKDVASSTNWNFDTSFWNKCTRERKASYHWSDLGMDEQNTLISCSVPKRKANLQPTYLHLEYTKEMYTATCRGKSLPLQLLTCPLPRFVWLNLLLLKIVLFACVCFTPLDGIACIPERDTGYGRVQSWYVIDLGVWPDIHQSRKIINPVEIRGSHPVCGQLNFVHRF